MQKIDIVDVDILGMNFDTEQKYIKQGYDFVIGIDEAGRGPLAGPVVAVATTVVQSSKFKVKSYFEEIKDSKKLTPKKREKLFEILTTNENIKYGIGIVSEKIIDKENILQATLIAMKIAVEDLMKKNPQITQRNSVILIDGKDILESLDFDQHSIIGGDDKVWSIAAASIIAKVSRDKIMEKYDKKYPQYQFAKHKGYGK